MAGYVTSQYGLALDEKLPAHTGELVIPLLCNRERKLPDLSLVYQLCFHIKRVRAPGFEPGT